MCFCQINLFFHQISYHLWISDFLLLSVSSCDWVPKNSIHLVAMKLMVKLIVVTLESRLVILKVRLHPKPNCMTLRLHTMLLFIALRSYRVSSAVAAY
jgi:hypothetical protein